ncbi:MAG: redoxin domain-containing protein [Verrucomicrobia bacterium]|nr:redoxin domain-containing protein [Verrucomicrobiota bacterium]
MKKLFLPLGVLLACVAVASAAAKKLPNKKGDAHALPAGAHELNIGDAAPDFALPGIDGKTHRLADYKNAKLLMIAFISNHCPDSHAAEGRIKQLLADFRGKGLALVAINPNNPDGLRLDELGYSKYNDGPDDMKKYAAEQGFNFPYLYDGETQAMAKSYGCLATPHVFLFDADRRLRYQGQFDDSRFADAATVKTTDARNAVEALLAGRPVPVETTKPHGCSTKWMEKKSTVAEADAKQAATPVDVEPIDTAGVTALRKNGTAKMRLFNVWATWCAPCVAEFPELVTTARKFGLRDFELITLSVDAPDATPKVKAFLEKKGAAPGGKLQRSIKEEGRKTNHYLYTGADVNELMKVLDPEWPGGVPHSVLVAPDGKILWRHNGPVDGDELREKILALMGPYYVP